MNSKLPRKFATRRLPRMFAYVLALFHPKLSIKQLKGTLGTYVDYAVGDAFADLSLTNYSVGDTLVDSVKSIQAQD